MFYYPYSMRHEDWTRSRPREEKERDLRFGPAPRTLEDKVTDLRAEVDGLAGHIKQELLAELRVEIERLIQSCQPSAFSYEQKNGLNPAEKEESVYAEQQTT
jgi:hypothetical protein